LQLGIEVIEKLESLKVKSKKEFGGLAKEMVKDSLSDSKENA